MHNTIPNRQAICETLMDAVAAGNKDIIALCSDSRGSASMAPFFNAYQEQSVEVGIAEQDLVGIAAGLAASGKISFAISPACFLSTRSFEQAKVDVAYSNTNVKLIGISGGVSYGALGMSHHSAQDIAAMSSIPNMRVYLPSDRYQTRKLIIALLNDDKPAYIRVGRNPVEDTYTENNCPFELDHANVLFGDKGADVVIVATGESVYQAVCAAQKLNEDGISTAVIDMYCVKPFDAQTLLDKANDAKLVVSVEEHAPYGGLGALVAQALSQHQPKPMLQLTLPDSPVITGTTAEVFKHYGLDGEGIAAQVKKKLEEF